MYLIPYKEERETWVQSQVESYQRLKKVALDAALLNTQHYKVRIKSKVEQSSEWSSTPLHLGVVAIQRESFRVIIDYGCQVYFTYECCILLIHPTKNINKVKERTLMNERNTILYKNLSLSHFILERGTQFVVSLRDRWRDIYSEKGLLLAPYLLPRARGCQRLHPLASRIVRDNLMPQIGCGSRDRLSILSGL